MEILSKFRETFNELICESGKKINELAKEMNTSSYVILKWKNKTMNLKLSSLLKIANYFNCSLEYLCGKTTTYLDFDPKPCPQFGEWIKKALKKCGKSSYQLFKHTNIKNSQFHYWIKGYEPLLTSLDATASFLGITLDQLVGREQL